MPNRLRGLLKGSAGNSDPDSKVQGMAMPASAGPEVTETWASEVGLDALPNDLTRMLYLASLRDCNSGRYLHPELSPQIGISEADRALCACHNQIFQRLLSTPTSGYVVQLEEYVRYARADRSTVLKTWQSLQAYRATVPVAAPSIFSDLYCLNIEMALAILDGREPG